MSNNPVLNFDILGDTVNYKDDFIKKIVLKYTSQTIVNKKGKEVANKDYNKEFAGIIAKLDASVDNFNFSYDANAKEGLVSYDGKDVNVAIGDPGSAYGTDNGSEGVLFEETKHAEQFLDGKCYPRK